MLICASHLCDPSRRARDRIVSAARDAVEHEIGGAIHHDIIMLLANQLEAVRFYERGRNSAARFPCTAACVLLLCDRGTGRIILHEYLCLQQETPDLRFQA